MNLQNPFSIKTTGFFVTTTTLHIRFWNSYSAKVKMKSQKFISSPIICNIFPILTCTLYDAILKRGTYACSTLRTIRKVIPNDVKSPPHRLLRGDHIILQDDNLSNLTTCVWQDTKLVCYIPSITCYVKIQIINTK